MTTVPASNAIDTNAGGLHVWGTMGLDSGKKNKKGNSDAIQGNSGWHSVDVGTILDRFQVNSKPILVLYCSCETFDNLPNLLFPKRDKLSGCFAILPRP